LTRLEPKLGWWPTIPASLLLMLYLEPLLFIGWTDVAGGALMLAGTVGVAILPPELAVVFASIAGFGLAGILTLASAPPPLVKRAADVASFSAATFAVSYTVAVLTALATGTLANIISGELLRIAPIALAALAVVLLGCAVGRLSPERRDHNGTDGKERNGGAHAHR